ncbi:amidase signature enzyme [Viridothelium virens]|uniref:Amidase signature enzyme n=1 Tax=Viridothelium virens TaxID=1048519 RepID=A0A6A6GUF2_VIRVR|nr:amidase signature enzyme [Viridothelium virens]
MKESDIISLSASDIQTLYASKRLSAVGLVKLCLAQIGKHNTRGMKLRAVLRVERQETLFKQAQDLDKEREEKGPRSPMHGIPVLVKDMISSSSTGLEMTCGSYALENSRYEGDATIVQRCRAAGMIVLAKSNLTEWGNMKDIAMTGGWSAFGGQTQSPYAEGGVDPNDTWLGHSNPGGSSSGSAAGVAAGFAPVSIGTESEGSIVTPASRAALYSIKPTFGNLPKHGVFSAVPTFESAGPLAKTPRDLADLTAILMDQESCSSRLTGRWDGLGLAFVDPTKWRWPQAIYGSNDEFEKQYLHELKQAANMLAARGVRVAQKANFPTFEEIFENKEDAQTIEHLTQFQLLDAVAQSLQGFVFSKVKSIPDIIEFNKTHPDLELPPEHPGQEALEAALKPILTKDQFERGLSVVQKSCLEAIERCLTEYGVDAILAPSESHLCGHAAAAGVPIGTIPLSFAKFNGRPFGFHILVRAREEETMFRIMSAWEATFPQASMPPPLLMHDTDPKTSEALNPEFLKL